MLSRDEAFTREILWIFRNTEAYKSRLIPRQCCALPPPSDYASEEGRKREYPMKTISIDNVRLFISMEQFIRTGSKSRLPLTA